MIKTRTFLSSVVAVACLPLACLAQRSDSSSTVSPSREVASSSGPASAGSPASSSAVTSSRSAARPGQATLHLSDAHAFRVGAGDVLHITVWEEPQLTTRAVVRPDGFISMPLVDEIQVNGLTPEQIQKILTEQVTRLVKHPRVSVVVEEIHSRVVYITGEVQHPGAYPLIEDINVIQLIARSGGLTDYAHKSKIYVLRSNTGQRMRVNYDRLLKGGTVEEEVALLPGDMVVIP